jgi:hypothetical protein
VGVVEGKRREKGGWPTSPSPVTTTVMATPTCIGVFVEQQGKGSVSALHCGFVEREGTGVGE